MTNPIEALRWAGYSEVPNNNLQGAHLDFQVHPNNVVSSSGLGSLANISRMAEDRFSRGFIKESMENVFHAAKSGNNAVMTFHLIQLQIGATEATVFSNLGKAVVSAVDGLTKTS